LARIPKLSRNAHRATGCINNIPREGGQIVRVFHALLVNAALTRGKSVLTLAPHEPP
jgi:hypothetical protein